jgi:glycosyltransferase involved in cell wall biosynthesis
MQELKFTFLIATRNRREALAQCLSSIEAQGYANREIVVVDDGSDDGTQDLLAERFPDVLVIRNPERRGIGVSLGRASELATGDIWVNLDDDAYLAEDNAVAEAARLFAEYPDFDVACFRCEAPDGTIRHREIPIRGKRMPPAGSQIAYFLGGAVAFRADALRDIGGYPSDIMYGSWENSVAFRLFLAGHRIVWAPSVRVVHLAIPSPHNTAEREANYIRTEVRLSGRYLPFPYAHAHALAWIGLYGMLATFRGHLRPVMRTLWQGIGEWGTLRKDRSARLSLEQTHRLSALGGRTWY